MRYRFECFVFHLLQISLDYSRNIPRQTRSKVVICGGGIMGAAVAYHLALFGWGTDTMVLEQGVIGGGSQWHSSGIVGTFKPTSTQVKLAKSSVELIRSLEEAGE